jgi:predicted RNA binding protein YcfA (HicA-like mRNA interferase family)
LSPRLPGVRPREVIRVLERAGWSYHHQRGSHRYFHKEGSSAYVSVPMHPGDVPRGTLRAILYETNITEDEFIEQLRG